MTERKDWCQKAAEEIWCGISSDEPKVDEFLIRDATIEYIAATIRRHYVLIGEKHET